MALVSLTGVSDVNQRLAISLVMALAGGLLLGWIWNMAASKFEWLQASTDIRAWDTVLTRSDWVQVWTMAGRVFTGHPQFVASSAETDDLDFYFDAFGGLRLMATRIRSRGSRAS